MFAARKRRRTQNVLLIVGLGLCLYFLLVYQPLSRRAAALDQPLLEIWRDLAQVSTQVTGPDHAQLPKLDAAFDSVQKARDILERSRVASTAASGPTLN
jgi:type II secretory pathway component PulM